MTRLDDLEASILAGALRAHGPPRPAEARVRAKTMAAIAAGAVVPGLAPSVLERLSSTAGDVLESLGETPTQARVLLGVVALSGAGIGGYALGFQAGRESSTSRVVTQPSSSSLVVLPPREEPSAASRLPEAQPEEAKPSPVSALRRAASAHPAPVVTAEPAASDPEEEVRALRRVERVLREHNPRFALALLSELDRTVPRGKLMEEREAARTVATCELLGTAPDRAAAYAARYPGSVYASRVQQACGAEAPPRERIPAPAETDQNQ